MSLAILTSEGKEIHLQAVTDTSALEGLGQVAVVAAGEAAFPPAGAYESFGPA